MMIVLIDQLRFSLIFLKKMKKEIRKKNKGR